MRNIEGRRFGNENQCADPLYDRILANQNRHRSNYFESIIIFPQSSQIVFESSEDNYHNSHSLLVTLQRTL